MKQLIQEAAKMQKLAGLITESQYKKILKEEQEGNRKIDRTKWYWDNNGGVEIFFKSFPSNPNELLTQHDEEYLDDPATFTKESFWETDILNPRRFKKSSHAGYYISEVVDASKESDGTWRFVWDSGDISGFKEGEDFDFLPVEPEDLN